MHVYFDIYVDLHHSHYRFLKFFDVRIFFVKSWASAAIIFALIVTWPGCEHSGPMTEAYNVTYCIFIPLTRSFLLVIIRVSSLKWYVSTVIIVSLIVVYHTGIFRVILIITDVPIFILIVVLSGVVFWPIHIILK